MTSDGRYYQISETQHQRKTHEAIGLRRFHNHVKHLLYSSAASLTTAEKLLDLGAGRGGDIIKYTAVGAKVIVAVEKDSHGLTTFQTRLKDIDWDVKYVLICGDMTQNFQESDNPDVQKWCTEPMFDIISCQFAMHYAFASKTTLSGFIYNINQTLKVGGVFIGTILDGASVRTKLAAKNPSTFSVQGRTFASLHMPQPADSNFVGTPLDVVISSIGEEPRREYLVDFTKFVQLMSCIGCKLTDDPVILPSASGHFTDLFPGPWKLTNEEQEYSGLHRYFIFERKSFGNPMTFQQGFDSLL